MVDVVASSDILTAVDERYFVDPGTITSLDGEPFTTGTIWIHTGRSASFDLK